MRYLSVCSGIEAASVAWTPLGWSPAAFSEIEPFPCAVLTHHYPNVPNWGDMTTIAQRILNGEVEAPDVLAGGTPCQAFSVAGLRKSLADERGNLTLRFVEIADAIDSVRVRDGRPPAIVFWENVPGVLSTKDNAFGCFLGALAGEDCELKPPGKRWADAGCVFGPQRAIAWRVLDAQYFGLAQRRRRVFVVASARDGFDPAAVLFEFDGVRRDTAPSREAREVAPTIPARSSGGGGLGTDFDCDGGLIHVDPIARCLTTGEAIPYDLFQVTAPVNRQNRDETSPCHTLARDNAAHAAVVLPMQVRRLTPRECERLMGFPDDYTLIPTTMVTHRKACGLHGTKEVVPAGTVRAACGCKAKHVPADRCPDGPRYKALGNSWAVPVVRWIGERINAAALAKENSND